MFHFIQEGRVKIVKSAAAGGGTILEILGAGEPVGVVAAYEERPFPASAVAIVATRLLSVPREEFFDLITTNPMLARGLLLGLTRRLMDMSRRLAEGTSRVEYRMARLFLALADRVGRFQDRAAWIPVRLSRREIADMVGTTQETAIRIMSRWGKEQMVLTEPDGFLLPDRLKLEEIPPNG